MRHIKGTSQQHIEVLAESVIERMSDYTYVYTKKLAQKLKKEGYFLIAISGSPSELVSRFADKYGFDTYVAAEYHKQAGIYTGGSKPAHTGKDKILTDLVNKHSLSWEDSYAVGDSPGDIGMLSLVANPIAFNPDAKLFEVAKTNNWNVVIERKNMSYELEHKDGQIVLA